MADTQNTQQKYFLDLGGLTTLWNKIKTSFADKAQTEESIGNINISLGDLDTRIKTVDNDVETLETTVLSFAPREVNYYAEAVESSKTMAPGSFIKVLLPETSAEDDTPSGYSTGIYMVLNAGEIKYISVSDGSSDESSLTVLGERVTSLEETVVKSAVVTDENGIVLDQTFSVTDNVLLIAHDNTFDINSESVRALTHRAVAAKFREVENNLSKIPKFKISVVDELPTDEISLSTIYLLRNEETYTNNLFTEYIYVEETVEGKTVYKWEKLGEQSLVVDDIVTKGELDQALTLALLDYAKKTDVQDLVNEAAGNLKSEILSTVEETYATKEEVGEISKDIEEITGNLDNYLTKEDAINNYLSIGAAEQIYLSKEEADNKGWMTEADIISSIQLGNIGNAIIITEEQIEEMIDNQ